MTVLERSSKRGNKAVGHVEQMHSSRCFRESRGEMGCISCHDPHQVPASEERTSYYRRQCLACHDQKPCSLAKPERLAKSRDDNCLQCHMPVASNTDVIHNATTDHRILRMPPDAVAEPSGSAAAGPLLKLFHASQLDPREREAMARELAIGLAYEARKLRVAIATGSTGSASAGPPGPGTYSVPRRPGRPASQSPDPGPDRAPQRGYGFTT